MKQKLKERPLKLDEALDIAGQTARGLQAAHDKDIVHRDIKSANLMVTAQSHVRIMDFGLARLADRSQLTKTDARLGTPAYMSPEQVRGKDADQRSDIWSLGVVLYQMVSGRLPFSGEAEAAVTYGILNEQPEPVTALRSGLPIELDRILDKALAKVPEERYQHVDEMLVDLRSLQRRKTPAAGEPTPLRPKSKVRLGTVAAAVLVVGLLLVSAIRQLTSPTPETAVVRLSVVLPDNTSLVSRSVAGPTPQIALSPDGRVLAYVASLAGGAPRLWTRALDSITPRELSGTDDASFPFWSPDSRFLGFFAEGKLKTVDAFGGVPEVIADTPDGRGGTWNTDGVILYAGEISSGLKWVPATGGVPSSATKLDSSLGEASHRFPRFLPDGRHFVYVSLAGETHTGVYVASLDSEVKKQLLPGSWSTPYAVADHLLSVHEGKLMAQPFDSRGLEVSGSPVAIAEPIGAGSPSGLAALSVSDTGTLCYASGASPNRELIWFDRSGARLGQVGEAGEYIDLALSPDEGTLAVARVDSETRTPDIWLFDTVRGAETRLTTDVGSDIRPQWSPDGSRMVFTSNRTGHWEIYEKVVAGIEPEVMLANDSPASHKWVTDWTPDSRHFVFVTPSAGARWDLWLFPRGDGKSRPLLHEPFTETQGAVSPRGDWIAYTSDETGNLDVYVQFFPSGGDKRRISVNGGWDPRWSADGAELFFLSLDGKLMVVRVKAESNLSPGLPQELFDVSVPVAESPFPSNYVVSEDGRRFLINTVSPQATSSPITVVLNGVHELAAR